MSPPDLTPSERQRWLSGQRHRPDTSGSVTGGPPPSTAAGMRPGDVMPEGMGDEEQAVWLKEQRVMLEEQHLRDMVDASIKMEGGARGLGEGEGEGGDGGTSSEQEVLFFDSPGQAPGQATPRNDEENVDPRVANTPEGGLGGGGTPVKTMPFASPTPSDVAAGLD